MTKFSEVKAGDVLVADGGFDCLAPGEHVVGENTNGLFVVCERGLHWIEGQVDHWTDGDGELIGLKKK